MSAAQKSTYCSTCGQKVDPLRAPRVRFSGRNQWFFCSAAHADTFDLPSSHQESTVASPASQGLTERPDVIKENPAKSSSPLDSEGGLLVDSAQAVPSVDEAGSGGSDESPARVLGGVGEVESATPTGQ